MEEFRDGTSKKTKVGWILKDLYEPKRILGLLWIFDILGRGQLNKDRWNQVRITLCKRVSRERKRRITDIMVKRCGTGTI
jgi:hypothetical protein